MPSAPLPPDEEERLRILRAYHILDTPAEPAFDRIATLAARLFAVPIALISLVDSDRQWFKSCCGLPTRQTERNVAFCAHAILTAGTLIVPDARRDARFADNPLVTGEPHIRFYAGAVLRTREGQNIGTLCLMDQKPRPLSLEEQASLEDLAQVVVHEMELRLTARALAASEAQHRTLLENLPDVISRIDRDLRCLYISPSIVHYTGIPQEGYIGKRMLAVSTPPDVAARWEAAIERVFQSGQAEEIEVSYPKPHGRIILQSRMVPEAVEGQVRSVMMITRDITERKQAEAQIERLAYHDMLTGLPNRLQFKEYLESCLATAMQTQRALGVLFLDLDRFKVVNDSLGHKTGDLLLQSVAERLMGCLRPEDMVSRLGGDEFVALLPDVNAVEDVRKVARRMLDALKPPVLIDGQEFFITASIGASFYPVDGQDAEMLIKRADLAMYRAKHQGRNRYQMFTPAMDERAKERLTLETNLHKALANDELTVHYQPQINLKTGAIVGAEALVRWQVPQKGLVSPADFIPLAEETGLIVPIGMWMLRVACAQTKAWQTQGYSRLRIGVNVSLRQLQQPDFVAQVTQILEETGLEPGNLDLEITESIAMENVGSNIAALESLRALGITLSLDDFGTGFSSLNHLKRLPIDTIKIDQSFVRAATTDARDAAIATGIIQIAHSLNLEIVAEGVEQPEQLTFLRTHRCDTMQGYLFSKPVPAEDLTRLLAEGANLYDLPIALPIRDSLKRAA